MKAVSALLAGAGLLPLVAALADQETMLFFNTSSCDASTDYYEQQTVGYRFPMCSEAYSDTILPPYFPTAGSDSVNAWLSVPTDLDGCSILILRDPGVPDAPPCGFVQHRFDNAGQCEEATISHPYYITYCCTPDECNEATGSQVSPPSAARDVAAVKRSNPFAARESLEKRDCGFVADGDVYTTYDTPQQVISGISCTVDTCTESVMTSVETSSTVSEEVGASLFDIISASVTSTQEWSYSTSHSTAKTVSYSASNGQSGYVAWYPKLQCVKGTFNGDLAGCQAPEGDQTSCSPLTLADGSPDGYSIFVQQD